MAAITAPQVTALNPTSHLSRLSPLNQPQFPESFVPVADLAAVSPSSSSPAPSVSPPAPLACQSSSPDAITMPSVGEKRPAPDAPSPDAAAMRPRKLFAASIPPLTIPSAPSAPASLAALSTAPLRLPSFAPAAPLAHPQTTASPPPVTLSVSYPATPCPVLPPRTRFDPVAFARGMQALQGTPLGRLLNATPDIVVDGVPRRVVSTSKPPSSPARQGAAGQSASPVPLMQLPSRLARNISNSGSLRQTNQVNPASSRPRLLVPSPAAIASAVAANSAAPSAANVPSPAAAPLTLLTCPIILPRNGSSAHPASAAQFFPAKPESAAAPAAAFDPLVECEESLDSLSDPSDLTSPATSACSTGGGDAVDDGAKDAMSSVAPPRNSESRWGRNRSVTSRQTAAGRRRQGAGKAVGVDESNGGGSAGAGGTDGSGACVITTSGQRNHTLHPAPAPPATAAARLLLHSASARSTSANPAAAAAAAAAIAAAAGFGFIAQGTVGGVAAAQIGVAPQQLRGGGASGNAAQLMAPPPHSVVAPQQALLSLSLPPPTARNQGFVWHAPRHAVNAPVANVAAEAAGAANHGQEFLPDTQLTLGRSSPPLAPVVGAVAHALVGSADRAEPRALAGPSLAPEQSASVSSSASTTVVTRTESQGWSDESDDEWGDGEEAESEGCGMADEQGHADGQTEGEAEPDGAHALVSAATPASVAAELAFPAHTAAAPPRVFAPRASRLVGSEISIHGLHAVESNQSHAAMCSVLNGGICGSGAIRLVGSESSSPRTILQRPSFTAVASTVAASVAATAAGAAAAVVEIEAEQLRESVETSSLPTVFADSSLTSLWVNAAYNRLVGQPCCSWLFSLGAASLPTITLGSSTVCLGESVGECPAVLEGSVWVRWQGRGGSGEGEGKAEGVAVGRRVEDSEGVVLGYLWELRMGGWFEEVGTGAGVIEGGVTTGGADEEGKQREEGVEEDEDAMAAESLLLFTGGLL